MSGLGSGAGCFGNWDCAGRNKQSIHGKVIKWTAPVQTFCFLLSIDGPCQSLVLWPNLIMDYTPDNMSIYPSPTGLFSYPVFMFLTFIIPRHFFWCRLNHTLFISIQGLWFGNRFPGSKPLLAQAMNKIMKVQQYSCWIQYFCGTSVD
jgi:hypothetical protein